MSLPAGHLIGSRYRIEREAGSGGSGTVYRAVDTRAGTVVALKVMAGMGASEVERFEREATALAELDHPAIVRYAGHGRIEDGTPYLAIEWLDGEDLEVRLTRGGLSLAETLALGRQVAAALAVAHHAGIVHRDIKPSNLYLVEGRVSGVKVLDFGHAQLHRRHSGLTQTGTVIGTPAYMAPEQARGSRDLDGRADLFSLGCVLFECLAGRPAFVGEHLLAVLARILLEDPPRLCELVPGVPAGLDALVSALLAKDQAARPADAATVIEALTAIEAGAEVPIAPPRVSRAAITGIEQRMVCAVLSARADPSARTWSSDADRALARVLEPAVSAHGCRLDLLWDGSALITLTGHGAATDQAAQAARCALAVRALLPEVPMVMAVGRAVVLDRVPIGEVLDRAARALRRARPSSVRIDEAAAALLESRFEVEREGDALYLGPERPVEAHRTLCGRRTSFVGRERELGSLLALWEECTGESVARAMLIVAPAGMGKSRLRDELVRTIRERAPSTLVLVGRGEQMRAGSALGMLVAALRSGAGILEGEPLELRQRKLRRWLGQNARDAELDRMCEFIGEMIGVPAPGPPSAALRAAQQQPVLMGDGKRTAFEDWLLAVTASQPALLVLEDLQWGDRPTALFVDGALRRLRDRPFMVLALARPEVADEVIRPWRQRELQVLQLGKLLRRGAEGLCREVLGKAASDETVARLVEQADGNAFYLEELIRSAQEGTALPPTILGLIQARLDALGPLAKRVLRAGSVFGSGFCPGGVTALVGGSRAEVERAVEDLVGAEIVVRRESTSYPGEQEYAFSNGLVHDAVYATLTGDDQSLAHRLAGEWLVHAGEQDAMILGQHFLRGEELVRAAMCFLRAAEQALEGNDLWTALVRAELATVCGAEGESLGRINLVKAEANRWRGELADAEQAATDAARDLPRGGALWFRAVSELLFAAGRQTHTEAVRAWALEGARADAQTDARIAQVTCLGSAGRQLFNAGLLAEAEELCGRVEALCQDAASLEPAALAELSRMRGARARHHGDPEADLLAYQATAEAYEAAGDHRNACNALVSLGFAFAGVGELDRAHQALARGLIAAERMELGTVVARACHSLGLVFWVKGELGAAREAEERAVNAGAEQKDLRFEGWSRMYLSWIAGSMGDLRFAEAQAQRAVELHAALPGARAGSLATLARVRLGQGRVDGALEAATRAHALLEQLGEIEELEGLVRLVHAEALGAAGQAEAARDAITRAVDRLYARASRIGNEHWRQGFLERVPDHARTLSLGRRLGVVREG